ncbi:MAG: hypothetical protein IPJ95_01615 [Gemmatimonadetes bacterium]|nr:hypothetical protein [Gemmatimonadota bacterium]
MSRFQRLLVTGLLLGALPPSGAQASQLATASRGGTGLAWLPAGQVVERVTSRSNRQQQYAAFLPSRYSTDQAWPVLVVLDPRGRALLPLERVREVADRLGYIVLSSWNSRSDEPEDHNADAINAILDDADRLLSIDPHRIYLVGQSGTARGSWIFGYSLRGNVAGIIGYGAGTPRDFPLEQPGPGGAAGPDFFGAAGIDDYNFDEMWALDARLDSVGIRHHIGWFDGVHAWPGAADLAEAVEWMHLQAMRRGLLAADRPWIDALYRSRLGDAAMMRAAGASYRAWRRFRAIETDFAGLHDIAAATEHRRELERQPGVFQAERHLGELVRQQEAFNRTLGEVLGDLRRTSQPLATSWRRLGLDGLVERARDPADTMGAHAARRALEQVWVYTSFYEPREHLVRQDPRRALALLAIAERLRPADPAVALYRAEALARLGRSAEAREALVTAARGGALPEALDRDPTLTALRADAGSRAVLARLTAVGDPSLGS